MITHNEILVESLMFKFHMNVEGIIARQRSVKALVARDEHDVSQYPLPIESKIALTSLREPEVFMNFWWKTMAFNGFIPQFLKRSALRNDQDRE